MTFVVTARKWRPQKFNEVVGQEHITTTLKNAIKSGRIAHAYIFTGPRGVGKTTSARILAKTLNCLNQQNAEPCNDCEMCKSIQSSQSLDIIEIDGASNRGIDEVRSLRDSVKYAPSKGKYKVYIIDEVHMLTKESFNAFLKTLEEPPEHTIFIFATTDIHKVPLTIISRCQRFDFRRIQLTTIKEQLKKIADEEKIQIDDKTLTLIAKKADGALRDAESFFDQAVSFCGNNVEADTVSKMLNLIDDEIYFDISDAVINKNFKSVFEVTKSIYENGWNFIDFMEGLVEHFRNILSVVVTESSDNLETAEMYRTKYMEYLGQFSQGDLLRLMSFLNKSQQELRYAQNQKLKVEIVLSHMIGLERSSTISEVLSNLGNDFSAETLPRNELKKKPENKVERADSRNKYQAQINRKNSETNFSNSTPDVKESISQNTVVTNNDVVKWNIFVDKITAERGLTLGNVFGDILFNRIEGNNLFVYSSNKEVSGSLKINHDYLEKKSLECFGRKLKVVLTDQIPAPSTTQKIHKTTDTYLNNNGSSNRNNPFVEAIINKLGGKEIS